MNTKEAWTRAYAESRQDGAQEPAESLHFLGLGLLLRQHPLSTVLDVGCGKGALRQHLPERIHYSGVDVADLSCDFDFTCADFREFHTSSRFSCVVLNESLYYMPPFPRTLDRAWELVHFGGILAISICRHRDWFGPNSRAAWTVRHWMHRHWLRPSFMEVTDGASWRMWVVQKRH